MIEIPPKFAGRPPVNPVVRQEKSLISREWKGDQGLAEDVRYYGQWMRDEAEKRIGHLYPKIEVTAEMAKERPDLKRYKGRKLTVIAWLWARTVKSPNPAFADVEVPLASTFMLSTKTGREAYVEPVIEGRGYRFTVKVGKPPDTDAAKAGTKLSRGANFQCVMSGAVVNDPYIKSESMAGRMGTQLMAIVAESKRGRVYLAPTLEHEAVAHKANPEWTPDQQMNRDTSNLVSGRGYGFFTWADLFTPRQLVALTTFSDLVTEARAQVERDAIVAGLPDDSTPLREGGTGATAYAEAVEVYLAFAVDKVADYWSSICTWHVSGEKIRNTFGRQAIPMTWDYAETNPLSSCTGNWMAMVDWVWKCIDILPDTYLGVCAHADASLQSRSTAKVVSTDPPYYDNIGYADLSDFFYVWLRRSLRPVFPDLFATLAVPKAEELVATPYRHGNKKKAEAFFLAGMTEAMRRLAEQTHPGFPVTIYYAFKQSEKKGDEGTSSTGIVLVCRQRPADAPIATRRDFVAALKSELPVALTHLQRSNIASRTWRGPRPGHGGLHPLRQGAGRRRQGPPGARSAGPDQPNSR